VVEGSPLPNLTFPVVSDALVAKLTIALGTSLVFDGPPSRYVGSTGVAVGATREDMSSEVNFNAADLGGGLNQELSVHVLAWSGSGDTTFKKHRDNVAALIQIVIDTVAGDRSLGGVVSTSDVTSGTWMQEQTGDGALVTCEITIYVRKF
jgi:hypothetical protein